MEWHSAPGPGRIEVKGGRLLDLKLLAGGGTASNPSFDVRGPGPCRLRLDLEVSNRRFGVTATLVSVLTGTNSFTFASSDVSADIPIVVPDFGVAVVPAGSGLTYDSAISGLGLPGSTGIGQNELRPETTFENAAAVTQDIPCETVLGLTRDNRLFTVKPNVEQIEVSRWLYHIFDPQALGMAHVAIPLSRGFGVGRDLRRRLHGGVLPILEAAKNDGDIRYEATLFATLLDKPLTEANVVGLDYLLAEPRTHFFGNEREQSEGQQERLEALRRDGPSEPPDPLVLCYRLRAINRAAVPRPAFFLPPVITGPGIATAPEIDASGLLVLDGQAYGSAQFDGGAWPEGQQVAYVLRPGESVEADYRILHAPLASDAAAALLDRPFAALLEEAVGYWRAKLASAASVDLPDTRVTEMIAAGLLHLDLITYGRQEGPLAACVGVYSPIGSESAPIIQFYDSMGWPSVAERCLDYFLEKQLPDGSIKVFGNYALETGCVLWTMGEHYRYTRDVGWAERVAPAAIRACEQIVASRHSGEGAPGSPTEGLTVGRVADPIDDYAQFMLNSYQYLGLMRAAELLEAAGMTSDADRFRSDAVSYRADIRRALFASMAESPLVPLADGRWVPSCPPWVGARGPVAMGYGGERSFTHFSVYARDSMLGPLFAAWAEVLEDDEVATTFLLHAHYEYMCEEGEALSQPYYSPHPMLHMQRGEVRTFLRAYYSGFAALADRETYTFWEHLRGNASPHKTHEEAWFLMQTRRMLYREDGGTLQLLEGIPRRWMASSQGIRVSGAQSYFGNLDLDVRPDPDAGRVTITVACPDGAQRGLTAVEIRLPHPDGVRRPLKVGGAEYIADRETVRIAPFEGQAQVVVDYS